MTTFANRFLAVTAAGLAWGCASEVDMPTPNDMVGTWQVTSAKLAALEPGSETMITSPVMVYPNKESRAPYLTKAGTVGLRFSGTTVFGEKGDLHMARQIDIDGKRMDESTNGTWYLQDGELIFDDPGPGFHIVFTPTFWSHDELHLLAERDNPEFSDTSCIYELTLRRQ